MMPILLDLSFYQQFAIEHPLFTFLFCVLAFAVAVTFVIICVIIYTMFL